MKPSKLRPGLFFGVVMAIFFVVQHLITDNNLTPKHVLGIVISSLVGGIIGALLFGWFMGSFASNPKYFIKGAEWAPDENETIEFETMANHFKGIEAVGGKLNLTNRQLLFKSHKLNIQKHQLSIPIGDIIAVHRYKVLGVVNTGLAVTIQANKIEKFVVQNPEEWLLHFTSLHSLQPLSS